MASLFTLKYHRQYEMDALQYPSVFSHTVVMSTSGTGTSLDLRIVPVKDAAPTPTSIPVDAMFINTGDDVVNILHRFEPIPVFFGIKIVRQDGTPIPTSRGGKIDLPETETDTHPLLPGESHTVRLDVRTVIPDSVVLEPGEYRVMITYHNQYGSDCFTGRVRSSPISLRL